MDAFLQLQIDLIVALQSLGELTGVMRFFTSLGSEEFFFVLMPFIYLCLDAAIGARLAVVLLLGDSLNNALKLAFHLPRPYWLDARAQPLATETSYGLPSGHAQMAASLWLLIAATLKKPWAWAGAVALVLLISFSRVYLGVHFPSDVVVGGAIGGLFLVAYLRVEPQAKSWLSSLGLWAQLGAALGLAAAILLVGSLIQAAVAGAADPEAWRSFAGQARSLKSLVTDAGAAFGVGVGLAMANRWARFSAGGSWGKRTARFGVGLICVGVFLVGLSAIFPREPETALTLALRFVRYGLTTWALIFVAPWLSLKLKLAEAI